MSSQNPGSTAGNRWSVFLTLIIKRSGVLKDLNDVVVKDLDIASAKI